MYTATLHLFGKKYTAKGETVVEAISRVSPGRNIKGKSILVLEKGDWKKERILQPLQTYRLFGSQGLMREVALKNASLLYA